MKVYGPYLHKKMQRRIVIIVSDNGAKTTKSYARHLMELSLSRPLLEDEEVDHIDGNKLNDQISNLQILSKGENIRKSICPAGVTTFSCLHCGKTVTKPAAKIRGNLKQGKRGPFCGKSCSGSYSWLHSPIGSRQQN